MTESRYNTQLLSLASDLQKVLKFHQQVGIDQYPKFEHELFAEQKNPGGKPGTQKKACPSSLESLDDINANIKSCSSCSCEKNLHDNILVDAPSPYRLMIVGDFCHPVEQEEFLFGRQEDEMLHKMVEAIGLKRDEVFITNCLKCNCVVGGQPSRKKIMDCFPFLVREIAVVKPPVICAMGELASQALLGVDDMLVRLRGKFHKYRYFTTYPVLVMPTFHPRFLLAHQEMKMATWQDLQLIQKRFLA